MATHFSIIAWRIPWTEKPGGLQSTGLQRVGQLSEHACKHALSKSIGTIFLEHEFLGLCIVFGDNMLLHV